MDKLKWITVEYTIAELKPQGGVVTQRDILERYKNDHPGKEVRSHANFKCNQENKTISIRVAIVTAVEVKILDEFADKDNNYSAAQKLLNPEYGELKTDNTALSSMVDGLRGELKNIARRSEERKEKCDKLQRENDRLILRLAEFDENSDTADLAEAKKVIAEDNSVDFKDETDG